MKRIKKIFQSNYIWIVCFVCLILFLALAEDVFNKDLMRGDVFGYNFIAKYLIHNSLTPIVKGITFFGGVVWLLILTIILVIFIKNRKIKILICSNLVIITLLNQVLKFILERPRPTEYRIINETGYSFPSGHSMISMAFYGFLIYLIYKYIKNKYLKVFSICGMSLLIVMIGISRVYLGVHYTSDVIGGFLISISYLIVFIKFSNKYILKEAVVHEK